MELLHLDVNVRSLPLEDSSVTMHLQRHHLSSWVGRPVQGLSISTRWDSQENHRQAGGLGGGVQSHIKWLE